MKIIGHKKQQNFLEEKFKSNQLSHAYLFTGPREIGKKTFAVEFVKSIGCNFPDLMIIEPDEGKEISIGKIREMQKFLSYKSYNGGFKAVVVDDAEKMNQEAQSCFLKTLEEPKGRTLLIIVSSKPDVLLGTITSRCQTLKFLRPKDLPKNPDRIKRDEEILEKIIPIINSSFAEKFKYVKSIDFQEQDILEILEVLQRYLRQLLITKVGANKTEDFSRLPEIKELSVEKLKKIINLIEDLNSKLLFTNASPKLALEILLMEF